MNIVPRLPRTMFFPDVETFRVNISSMVALKSSEKRVLFMDEPRFVIKMSMIFILEITWLNK